MNRKLLITGGSGQLGHALTKLAVARGVDFAAVSRPEFDFDRPETIEACLNQVLPSLVVNAAAYTAVDAAETQPLAAFAANHIGPQLLAAACAKAGIPLIHLSTDYVFDGSKGMPYVEDDVTSPAGVYGASKREGEAAILRTNANAIILRTAWVYAAHGKNFARSMLSAARQTNRLRVVADQRGTPTAAPDLAAAIFEIIGLLQNSGWRDAYRGIYHATGNGETTWFGFAEAIFEIAANAGLAAPSVSPITTADWPTPAKRPADSRLDCSKLERIFGCRLPHWRETLPEIVKDLLMMDATC